MTYGHRLYPPDGFGPLRRVRIGANVRTMGLSQLVNPQEQITTDGNWTEIASVPLASDGDSFLVVADVLARRNGSDDRAAFGIRALLAKDGSQVATLVGSVLDLFSPIRSAGAGILGGNWQVRAVVPGDNTVRVEAKGQASATIGWQVSGRVQGLNYG